MYKINTLIKKVELNEYLISKINHFLRIDELHRNWDKIKSLGFQDNGLTVFEKRIVMDDYTLLMTVNKGYSNGWVDFSILRHEDKKWFDSEPIFSNISGKHTIHIEAAKIVLDIVAV